MKYTIKKGRHYHNNNLMRMVNLGSTLFNKQSITKKVMLTEQCWYPSTYVQSSGYNKLFGAGQINHHNNSARFVWMPDYDNSGQIRIYSYVYKNGVWAAEYLFNAHVGQWYQLTISIVGEGYMFEWLDDGMIVPHPNPSLRKPLDPYHGGNDTAYRTMSVYIR